MALRTENLQDAYTTIKVEQSLYRGKLQEPNTANAKCLIDIPQPLAALLHEHMIGREGFVFQTRSGAPVSARNIERDTLRKMFVEMEIQEEGLLFHSFRRFRAQHLRKQRVPWDLEKLWMGHAAKDVSDKYAAGLAEDVAWRKDVAEKTGWGFVIPALVGQPVEVVEVSFAVELVLRQDIEMRP